VAAGLALGLALSTASPTAGLAQRLPSPELTFTPQKLPPAVCVQVKSENCYYSSLWGVSFTDAEHGHAVGAYHTVFRTADGGETWVRQDDPLPHREAVPYDFEGRDATDPTNGTYVGVSFVDADHGAVVSNAGHVLVTSDGGTTWQTRPTPHPSTIGAVYADGVAPRGWSFSGVSFVDRDHGYVIGSDGLILATADNGLTWTYRGKPQYGNLQDLEFVDEFHGQIVGANTGRADAVGYTTLGTNDAGETWQANLARPTGERVSPINLHAVAVTVPMHAVAVGTEGRIFVTFDEGFTWRNRRSGTNEDLRDVAFADRRRGLVVGGVNFQGDHRGIVLATNDGGERWTAIPQPDVGFYTSVSFATPTTAFAVGCADRLTDGPIPGVTDAPILYCTAAITKIDFPELDASVEAPQSSGGSRLPLYLLGAAVLVGGSGLLLARRR
jgi:photosystem II stability/assembly factor-like uncharacterized protein